MIYRVILTKVKLEHESGMPSLSQRQPLRAFKIDTSTSHEIELLYILTTPTDSFHKFLTMRQPDGYYLLTVSKQAVFNPAYFTYYGYAIVHKIKDMIFWENRYLQVGDLNALNLQTRDVQEEVHRVNWNRVPGTIAPQEATLEERLDRRVGIHR